MVSAVFHDKVGGSSTLEIRPGQIVKGVLRANGIPANAVLTYINGQIVSESTGVIGANDFVEFRQVRHYDLNVIRQPHYRIFSAIEPIYTKSILFDNQGETEIRSEQFDRQGFVNYVEQAFVESIEQKQLMQPGCHIVTGLSGGRDSVSFLKLLERTRTRLPNFSMTAVTVTGLPDWEEPQTFNAAKSVCSTLGIEHVIVKPEAIAEVFHLFQPFVKVMSSVVAGENSSWVMLITHHVMRRMIEVEAEKRGTKTIALGLNADDLVASLITWFSSGFQMGPIPSRNIGSFDYIFPLYRITKKELTLYLEIVSPELNRQGAPGRFTTGPGERSLAYAVTDHLYEL
jgi:sulfur carrier protein ThiS